MLYKFCSTVSDTDNELKGIRKLIYKSITELQSYEHKSIKELQKQYDDLTIVIANGAKQKLLGKLDVDDTTYKELMKKWQREKDEIGSRIANLSANSKDTMTRMDILTDFANKIPELYLKANVEEKRIIIGTITDRIILDVENNKIKVKLKPVFEYLRQLKLQNKESFSADIENLSRTLKTRTNNGTQAVENRHVDLDELTVTRTRKKLLNTEIEPHIEALNEINVVGGTRTPTDLSTRPSSVRVYHSATTTWLFSTAESLYFFDILYLITKKIF